jgi:conjugal transfer pilus assembly protein TraI
VPRQTVGVAWMSSLGSLFVQWFGPPTSGPQRHTTPVASAPGSHRSHEYPPVDTGLPAIAVPEVIAPQAELLKRLRDAYGVDQAKFDRDIASVVERYAQFVHLLPATPDSYFRGAGGLFRMGLEVGFFALQATDSAIFSGRQTITQRSALEPRWRYATFIAGLLSELHRALSHFIVTDGQGHEWPAYLQPLALWLRDQKASRYYVRWLPNPQHVRALGVVATYHIVTPPILQYLAEGNSVVIAHLMASLSGTVLYREANTLDHLVRRSAALVIDRDLRSNVDLYGKPQLGSHLERYLVDAMRRLVAQDKWIPNADKSRLWYGEDGMFVLWPQAAADMIELLHQDQLPGIPKASETIAEILAAAGVIEPRADGSLLWDIFVSNAAASSSSLKVASPLLLLSSTDAASTPLPRPLLKPAANKAMHSTPVEPQLSLPIPEPSSRPPVAEPISAPQSVGEPDAPIVAPAAVPLRVPVALNAPPRLNPAVRDALQQILATLDSPTQALSAFVIDLGVFVPLVEFERRSVDPALAVRALSDTHLLASDPNHPLSKTHSRSFHDQPILGIVLAPHCVVGLDEGGPNERKPSEPPKP